MTESIIEGIRTYISECPLMSAFDNCKGYIDWTDADNNNYGIYPDTDVLIDTYIDGTQVRQYTCQITLRKFAKADANRLDNSAFMENLQSYFDDSGDNDYLPDMPDGYEAKEITAANAMLMEQGVSGKTGTYTIQLILTYVKKQ